MPSKPPLGSFSVSPAGVIAVDAKAGDPQVTRLVANGAPSTDLPCAEAADWSPTGSHLLLIVGPGANPGRVLVSLD